MDSLTLARAGAVNDPSAYYYTAGRLDLPTMIQFDSCLPKSGLWKAISRSSICNRDLAYEFDYRCKQAGQLASKMRFLAAPWLGMLQTGAWLRCAAQANTCAQLLEEQLRRIPGARVMFPRQANSVFVEFPQGATEALHDRGWKFYTFIGCGGARLMCDWDTTPEDVRVFIDDVRSALRS
jgi:threonine aldolase